MPGVPPELPRVRPPQRGVSGSRCRGRKERGREWMDDSVIHLCGRHIMKAWIVWREYVTANKKKSKTIKTARCYIPARVGSRRVRHVKWFGSAAFGADGVARARWRWISGTRAVTRLAASPSQPETRECRMPVGPEGTCRDQVSRATNDKHQCLPSRQTSTGPQLPPGAATWGTGVREWQQPLVWAAGSPVCGWGAGRAQGRSTCVAATTVV